VTPIHALRHWLETVFLVLHGLQLDHARSQLTAAEGGLDQLEVFDDLVHGRASLRVGIGHVIDQGGNELKAFLVLFASNRVS
jgi:hypothetical protein